MLAAVALALALASMSPQDRRGAWRTLGVPALLPDFADARVITSGWECSQIGFDVLATNPCDPWNRPMNYPRIWAVPSVFGLGQEATGVVAGGMIAIFAAALFALVGRLRLRWAFVYGVAIGSPSVLLAIERGNIDLVIFALVAASVMRGGRGGVLTLLVATALKLYPIAGVLALRGARERLTVLLAGALYIALTLGDVRLIIAGTPRFPGWSYGLTTGAETLGIPAALLAVIGMTAAVLLSRGLQPSSADERTRRLSTAGASIFLATYVLGPSWAYRLIFLLLTLPAAITSAQGGRPSLMILMLLVLWLSSEVGTPLFVVDQLAHAFLAVVLGAHLMSEVWADRANAV